MRPSSSETEQVENDTSWKVLYIILNKTETIDDFVTYESVADDENPDKDPDYTPVSLGMSKDLDFTRRNSFKKNATWKMTHVSYPIFKIIGISHVKENKHDTIALFNQKASSGCDIVIVPTVKFTAFCI